MRADRALAAILLGALALSGCAYKPLKAPCAPDEGGQPLAYADPPPALAVPEPLRAFDSCGPMRPIGAN
jgi:hypothetical protein